MPEYRAPGIYTEEIGSRPHQVDGAATGIAGFVGAADAGPQLSDVLTRQSDFDRSFAVAADAPLSQAVHAFFENGGRQLYVARTADAAGVAAALDTLATIDEIDIVAAPGMDAAAALVAHVDIPARFRLALIDPPAGLGLAGVTAFAAHFRSAHAALYWPWVLDSSGTAAPPSGYAAGVIKQTDVTRGIWHTPATNIVGTTGLQHSVTSAEQDLLGPHGINSLRILAGRGTRIWGARTLSIESDWKYISVRRLSDWIEKSVRRSLRFAAFEPNGLPLWSVVKQMIETFLLARWKEGALVGAKPEQAFFVRCDHTTMTQNDFDNGRMVVMIGISPLRPAEFVVIRLDQITADLST